MITITEQEFRKYIASGLVCNNFLERVTWEVFFDGVVNITDGNSYSRIASNTPFNLRNFVCRITIDGLTRTYSPIFIGEPDTTVLGSATIYADIPSENERYISPYGCQFVAKNGVVFYNRARCTIEPNQITGDVSITILERTSAAHMVDIGEVITPISGELVCEYDDPQIYSGISFGVVSSPIVGGTDIWVCGNHYLYDHSYDDDGFDAVLCNGNVQGSHMYLILRNAGSHDVKIELST